MQRYLLLAFNRHLLLCLQLQDCNSSSTSRRIAMRLLYSSIIGLLGVSLLLSSSWREPR